VEGAGNLGITSSSFRDDLSRLDPVARYVVYCQSGRRDAQRHRQAAEAQLPTSALVGRLLRQAVQEPREHLTTADVESIARRVAREELHRA